MNSATLRIARQDLRALKTLQAAKRYKSMVKSPKFAKTAVKAGSTGMGTVLGAAAAGALAIGKAYGDFSRANKKYTKATVGQANSLISRAKSMRKKSK